MSETQVEYRKIQSDTIRVNPEAMRGIYSESEQFSNLCKDVAVRGVLQAIEVREKKDPDGTVYYEVCDGGHRFAAAKIAGITELTVKIVPLSDAEVEEHQLVLNLHKVDTRPIDYTKQLIKMLQRNPLMTEKELAELVSSSESFVRGRLGLLKLTPELQEIVNNGDILLTNALELKNLPKEEQVDWLEAAMTEEPATFVPKVKARVAEIRKAAAEGRKANPVGFMAVAKLRTKAEVEARLAEATGKEKSTLQWVLQLNDDAVKAAEDEYNAKQRKKTEESAKRKAEKEKKAAEEAAKKAADAEAEVARILG